MNKKFIIVAVVILAISVLLVACKGKEEEPQTTEPEITTAVDDKGAYVFNKNNEKVYLVDEQGFNIDPKDAVNMAGTEKEEDGFYIGGATDGEKVPNISWEELQ